MSAVLFAAAVLTSCNQSEDISEIDNSVRFTAGIEQTATPSSRASGTDWGVNDAIGIFMVDAGTTTIAESAANRLYTAAGNGQFTANAANKIYYPMDGSKVDFIAYYPWTDGMALTDDLDVDVSGAQTAAKQAATDLLWANTTTSPVTGYDKETNKLTPIDLAFNHKLAKFVMNCRVEENVGITTFDDVTLSINGMNTQSKLLLSDGTLGTASTPAAITPRKLGTAATGYLASYDAIVLPGTYAANVVTVTITINATTNPEIFTWKVPATEFQAGKEHIYDVTLTRTGVSVTGLINDWISVGRLEAVAE